MVDEQHDLRRSAERAYERLVGRLDDVGRRKRWVRMGLGWCVVLSAFVAWVLVLGVIEGTAYLPPWVRTVLLIATGVLMAGLLGGWVVRPLCTRVSLEALALQVERMFPELGQRLIGTLQLWPKRGGDREGYSPDLIEAMVLQTEEIARVLDFNRVVDSRPLFRWAGLSGGLMGGVLLLWLAFPGFIGGALYRYAHPSTVFQRPVRTMVTVSPGNTGVLKGDSLAVQIALSGRVPASVHVFSREEDMAVWKDARLNTRGRDSLQYVWSDLVTSMDYYVVAGDARSEIFRVTVIERPMVRKLQLTYLFPSYSGLPQRVGEEGEGDIRALFGTTVTVNVIANKPLSEMALVLEAPSPESTLPAEEQRGKVPNPKSEIRNPKSIRGQVEGCSAHAQLLIKEDGTYTIALRDRKGYRNADPIQYRMEVIEDAAPYVEIVYPGKDTDLPDNMLVPLTVEAGDDFGLSDMQIVFGRVGAKTVSRETIPFDRSALEGAAARSVRTEFIWNVGSLDLLPEDQVRYHVEVWDNDALSGPKRSKSKTFVVRFPSIYEIFEEVGDQQKEQVASIEDMIEAGREMKERVDEIQRELLRDRELKWEERKDLEAITEKQAQMAQQMKALSEAMEETIKKLEQSDITLDETLEKLSKIQQLMEEIATPELRKAMESLQKAIEQLDPKALQRAVENFSLSQEEFQKGLDRTLDLLKRVQVEMRLDAAVKMAEELVRRQEEVNMKAAEESQGTASAQKEQRIGRDTERLQGDLEELSDRMEEMSLPSATEIEQLSDRMDENGLKDRMDQMSQMLAAGDFSSASPMGQALSGDLNELQQGLQDVRDRMKNAFKEHVAAQMQRVVGDLLYLSQHQEQLSEETSRGQRKAPSDLARLADREQALLEGMRRTADRLYSLGQQTFFVTPEMGRALGQALDQMGEAIAHLEAQNSRSAQLKQQEAFAAMNRAALLIHESLQQLSSCPSGLGFEELMQQLKKLAGQQKGINQQTQPLGQSPSPSLAEQALMQRLAAQQAVVQQQLEELMQQIRGSSGVLGRLDQLGQEMDEVVKDLQRRHVDPQTIERQQRILQRLLDAQRSVRRRDYSRRRQAERPGEVVARNPGALPEDLGERQDALRRDLLKALKEGYPAEYQELIRQYFNALSKTEVQ